MLYVTGCVIILLSCTNNNNQACFGLLLKRNCNKYNYHEISVDDYYNILVVDDDDIDTELSVYKTNTHAAAVYINVCFVYFW